jgi:hypothetical protein
MARSGRARENAVLATMMLCETAQPLVHVMRPDTNDGSNVGAASVEAGEAKRRKIGAGVAFSILLHGLALAALIFILKDTAAPVDSLLVIPVDIAVLTNRTAGPIEPKKADLPREISALPSSPAAKSATIVQQEKNPPPDDLEVKLRKLARLREPLVNTHISNKGEGLARVSAMREQAAVGSHVTIKDFLRAQIERHWTPDLAALHGRNFSVLIRVKLTSTGFVTAAEVLNNPQVGADKPYDEVALSARNAALLSSPFTLPPGHYPQSMDLILTLNTQDATH